MSSVRNYLAPFKIITNGDMSGNLTSLVTSIKNTDNVSLYFSWTGTPNGSFSVYGNLNNDVVNGVPLTLTPSPVAIGTSGSILINMQQLAFPYIYVVYTKTSGSGTLQVSISGKGW